MSADSWELPRVHQLDSLLLEDEAVKILNDSFWRIFDLFKVSSNRRSFYNLTQTQYNPSWNPVVRQYIQVLTLALSLGKFGIPFGATMLNLKLEKIILILALVASKHIPTCKYRLSKVLEYLEFANHVTFMLDGKYPSILYRIFGLKLIPKIKNQHHSVDVSYMNRQLLWQAFTVQKLDWIAVGYGTDVELLRCTKDRQNGCSWSHSVVLSQKFKVKSIAWKGFEHLIVLGDSLSVWECVMPMDEKNRNAPDVWICSLAHSLPTGIEYAEMSPCENYLATRSSNPEEYFIRIYKICFATESSHLKKELGRLLGRSFSQNLKLFGETSNLFYIPLVTPDVPTGFTWRPMACDDETADLEQNPALLVTTRNGSECLFIKDCGARLDGNDEFILSLVEDCTESGPHVWWEQNSSICQLIGEGNAVVMGLSTDGEACLSRISGVELSATSIVSIDRLLNVSCTWENYPATSLHTVFTFINNVCVWADLEKTMVRTAQLVAVNAPFEAEETSIATDYNIEPLSLLVPSLPPNPIKFIHSSSAAFGYVITKSDTICFAFDGVPRSIASVPKMKSIRPSLGSSCLYGVSVDGQLYRLSMNDSEALRNLGPIEDCVGEVVDPDGQMIPVVKVGNDYMDLAGRRCTPLLLNDASSIRVFGTLGETLILASTEKSLDLIEWQNADSITTLCSVPIYRHPDSINNYGDAVVFETGEVMGTILVSVYTTCPSEDIWINRVEVDLLAENPLCHAWCKRDLYIALSDGIIKYSVSLSPCGSERWQNVGTCAWPETFSRPFVDTSISLSISFDNFIWLILGDGLFRLPPISVDQERPINCIPDRIVSYRTINFVLSDSFDRLEILGGGESLKSLRKTPCKSQEIFSFFDDIAALDLGTDDIDNESIAGPQPLEPSFLSFNDETRSIGSLTSWDTTHLSRLSAAVTEATKLLQENESAVDFAGSKYLFFAKLSWEASEEFFTHGFEYLAASLSDAQEILITKTRELIGSNLSWCKFSHFAMGFWIRNGQRLRELLEDVARTDFNANRDPAACAILYIILGRRSLLKSLWKAAGVADQESSRMVAFLSSDFTDERVKSIAAKNAFAALSKQRIRLAIIFFILAGRLEDSLQVCFERLEDYHLGFLIARFVCGKGLSQKNYFRRVWISKDARKTRV